MVSYWGGGYFGESSLDDSVKPIFGKQDTSVAAKQAVQEQAPGDEFHPLPNPEIEMLVTRLNELENDQRGLSAQLYGPPGHYDTFKGPPYMQRAMLQEKMGDLDTEICRIKAWLSAHIDSSQLDAPGENDDDDA